MKSAATFQRRMQVSCVSSPGKSAFGANGQLRGRASQAPRLQNPPGPRALPPPQTANRPLSWKSAHSTFDRRTEEEEKNGALTENGEPPDFRCKVTFYAKRNVTSITGSQL